MEATLVFPHQLFNSHPSVDVDRPIFLLEHPLFFYNASFGIKFHKQKLVLHRASMKYYESSLKEKGYTIHYIDYSELETDYSLKGFFQKYKFRKVYLADTVDFDLRKFIRESTQELGMEIEEADSPNFINSVEESEMFFRNKKRMLMADFYKYQRKRLGIMVDGSLAPWGGKWSFDEENRKKLPKKEIGNIPVIPASPSNAFTEEATAYVEKYFSDHPGSIGPLYYPITHAEAENWLEEFFQKRFFKFGPYEDAIVEEGTFLFHGVLTPMLNIGLLDPMNIIRKALSHYKTFDTPLASLEGFVRQIIGWREFIRYSYEVHGVEMRTTNHWKHGRKIPTSFYDGSTGIKPLDVSINRTVEFAYCHHIERLMVLGGFMFLCEFHPDEIYKWFMEMFIDSYDWVMVPNVYAMSQHADGGLITTKPYFSGSNYVRKMSHYKTGEWSDIWDGLYWKFIFDHSAELAKNPRWAMMVRTAMKMDETKRAKHMENASGFLTNLS